MLELRQSAKVASTFFLVGDKLYSLLSDKSAIHISDSITGQLESSINTRGLLPNDVSGINVTDNKMIVFNGHGVFVCFDIENGSLICTLSTKMKQNKLNTIQSSACRSKDDLLFVLVAGTPSLSALYLSSSSATIRTNIRLPDIMEKNKQEIVQTFCHPVKPFVFVCHKKGSVQVWNYIAVRKHLVTKSGSEDSEQDGGGFGGGGGDSDDDNDDASVGDDDQTHKTKVKVEKDLLPVALLSPPENESGKLFNRAVISPCGRLCAVSWGKTVCVYNVTLQFTNKKHSSSNSNNSGGGGREWAVAIVGSFTITPSMDFDELGPMAFHPSEPILFQVFLSTGTRKPGMVRVRVAALSLLVSALRVTAVHLLPHLQPQLQLQLHTHHRDTGAGALGVSEGLGQSSQCTLMDLQCNRGGHLVLTLDRGEGESEEGERRRSWHLEQYSLQNEFQSRGGCWLTPLISKLVVPPDTFLTGDQLLLHKDTSNTPGGHLPLVLLLHATSQVFQTEEQQQRGRSGTRTGTGTGTGGDASASGTRSSRRKPVFTTLTLYRVKLTLSSQETSGAIPLGVVPTFTRKESLEDVSRWLDLAEDDIIHTEGFFSPTKVQYNELLPGGVADNNEWYALLRGCSWTMRSAGDANMSSNPVMCFLCFRNNTLSFSFGNFRDVIFWSGKNVQVQAQDIKSRAPPVFLALSESGLQLKVLRALPPSSSGTEESKSEAERGADGAQRENKTNMNTNTLPEDGMDPVELPLAMSSMWTSPVGGQNRLLLASAIQPNQPAVAGLEVDEQHLFLTAPGEVSVDLASTPRFSLGYGESVVEVCWQAFPSSTSSSSSSSGGASGDLLIERHHCWVDSASGPMLGVLTSHRVLLLSSSFTLLNCYWSQPLGHSGMAGKAGTPLSAKAVSICWVGSSLLYTLESGAVNYLVTHNPAQHLFREKSNVSAMATALFGCRYGHGQVLAGRRLCTLPTAHAGSGCVRLALCLPDRLVYMTREVVGRISTPSLIIRPCLPLEPLVCGLLQPSLPALPSPPPPSSSSDSNTVVDDPFAPKVTLTAISTTASVAPIIGVSSRSAAHLSSLILSLLTMYVPAKPAIGMSTEGGALPMTHATRNLCYTLSQAGFEQLALVAAGVCSNDRDLVGPDFLPNRWISPGVKFHLAIQAGSFSTACSDLLAAKPELQELFLDPESYGGGILPHPQSALARQYTAAAYVLAMLGQRDMARKLADLAGDDELLALLLQTEAKKGHQGSTSNSQLSNLKTLQEAIKGRNAALYQVLQAVTTDMTPPPAGQEGLEWHLQVSSIGQANRRTTMLGLSAPLSNDPLTSPSTSGSSKTGAGDGGVLAPLDLAAVERAQRSHASQRGGGVGPPTKLGLLAMDSVEDWLGKSLPEVVVAGASDSNHLGGAGAGGDFGDEEEEEHQYPGGIARPDSWVDDIGTGKEWDKVVGYWRFSDLIRPGESHFLSSAGDGEAKSRLNMLDLSNFHTSLEVFSDTKTRLKLETTLSAVDPGEDHLKVKELNDLIFSTEAFSPPPPPSDALPVVGMRVAVGRGSAMDIGMYHLDPNRQRITVELNVLRLETASNDKSELHSLVKRVGGAKHDQLLWGLFVDNVGNLSVQIGNDAKNVLVTTANDINMGPTEDMPVSLWSHVAAVLDSTTSHTTVSLYINGDRVAKAQLMLPALPEATLTHTTLYVGGNLRGWRLAELRFWADSRSVIDIDSMKENYLPLASKRKRMQFRIKGSKQLFGPASTSLLLGAPSDSTVEGENTALEKVNLLTRDVSSRKGFGLAGPGGSKSMGLGGVSKGRGGGRGGWGLAAPGVGVGRANSRRGAVVQGELKEEKGEDVEERKGEGLKSPSLKRMSAVAGRGALGGSGGLSPPGKGAKEPSASALLSPAQRRLKARQLATSTPEKQEEPKEEPKQSTSPAAVVSVPTVTGGLSTPTKAATSSSVSSSASSTLSPAPSKPGVPTPTPTPTRPTGPPTVGVVWSTLLQDIAGYSALDLCKCIRRRPLEPGALMTVPYVAKQTADTKPSAPLENEKEQDKLMLLQLSSNLQYLTTTADHADDKAKAPYTLHEMLDITAESVIATSTPPSDLNPHLVVAYYQQKRLTVRHMPSGVTMAEMPMTAPLIFWTFCTTEELLLVTSTALFAWSVKGGAGAATAAATARPVKLCDRVDVLDAARWMDRKVLDVVRHPSGWILLTSCPRVAPGGVGGGATYAQAMTGCRVTLYHPSTQRSLQLAATCGAFLPPLPSEKEKEKEGEGGADPLVGLFACHHSAGKQSQGQGQLWVLDLRAASSELLATPSLAAACVQLATLGSVAEESALVSWSLTLTLQHTHTEEYNHSAFTVPGFLLGSYTQQVQQQQEEGEGKTGEHQQRICVLTNSGDLYVICTRDRKLVTSGSVSNESIVASTLVYNSGSSSGGGSDEQKDTTSAGAGPIIYMVAGSTGMLSAISPALLE